MHIYRSIDIVICYTATAGMLTAQQERNLLIRGRKIGLPGMNAVPADVWIAAANQITIAQMPAISQHWMGFTKSDHLLEVTE
jgi:hypothetical protein